MGERKILIWIKFCILPGNFSRDNSPETSNYSNEIAWNQTFCQKILKRTITLIIIGVFSPLNQIWLYFMKVYLCMKNESSPCNFSSIFQKMELKKSHNSYYHNRRILTSIELELYFMIIYLCVKYESNKKYSLKITNRNHFQAKKAKTPKINGGPHPRLN